MTRESANARRIAYYETVRAEAAIFAAEWRARWNAALPANCTRCLDAGVVRWCGDRTGPCPRCQAAGAARFVEQLRRETFGDPRERAFRKAFSGRPSTKESEK